MELDWSERYQPAPIPSGRRPSGTHRTIENLQNQLEACKQKNDELEMRALTAEMDATHQNLEMNNLMDKAVLRETTISRLERELEESRRSAMNSEKTLERFQRKINRLRVALTREIEKIRQSENETRSNFNLLFQSSLQFRNNELSKEDFISVVSGLEFKLNPSLVHSVSPSPAVRSSSEPAKHLKPMPKEAAELEIKQGGTPPSRQSHIHSLVGMLTEQGMCASTDDELLEEGSLKSSKKLPPTSRSVPCTPEGSHSGSSLSEAIRDGSKKDGGTGTKSHSNLSRKTGSFRSMHNFPFMDRHRFSEKKRESDSDNSDFEFFLPPPKNPKDIPATATALSPEVPPRKISVRLEIPDSAALHVDSLGQAPAKKVSTTNEDMYTPMASASAPVVPPKGEAKETVLSPTTKRALFGKSISSDSFYYESISRDDSRYEPLPELNTIRPSSEPEISNEEDSPGKGAVDVSLARSQAETRVSEPPLPTATQELERPESQHEYETDDECCYLDPKDLESQPTQQQLRRASLEPKEDEEVSSTYLTLLEAQLEDKLHEKRFGQHMGSKDSQSSNDSYCSHQSYSHQSYSHQSLRGSKPNLLEDRFHERFSQHMGSGKDSQSSNDSYYSQQSLLGSKTNSTLNIISGIEKWRVDSSCPSGYSTDSSSNWEQDCDMPERPVSRQSTKVSPSSTLGRICKEDEVGSSLDFISKDARKSTMRRRRTSLSCPGDFGDGEIYAEIDELDNEAEGSEDKDDDDDDDEGDYIPSDKYVSLFKNRDNSGHGKSSVASSASGHGKSSVASSVSVGECSPLLTATVAPDSQPTTVDLDASYETLYMGGPIANANVQHHPPSLPPRTHRSENFKDAERVPKTMRRHISVPLDKSSDSLKEKKDSVSSVTSSPTRMKRSAFIGGGSTHTFSPLMVQSKAGNLGSQGDLSTIHTQRSVINAVDPRIQFATLPFGRNKGKEKMGFLKKMDPKKKNWNRRWFVLKGVELRYFKSNKKTLKGIINLDSWCKLNKGSSPESFQIATQKKVYYLGCHSEKERNEWVEAIEAMMQLQQPVASSTAEEKNSVIKISGWATLKTNGASQRRWCVLKGSILSISSAPGAEPNHLVKVAESSIHKKRDSIVVDSVSPSSDFLSILYSPLQDCLVEIQPEEQVNKDSWYTCLCSVQLGRMDMQQTSTEKMLAEIEQSDCPLTHKMWGHPLFSVTTSQLTQPLTSINSDPMADVARQLFQHIQTFIFSQISSRQSSHELHVSVIQDMVGVCLAHVALQDEVYCQILRQINGHQPPVQWQVAQGWLLLSVVLSSFLPMRPRILWYLQTFLNRHSSSHRPSISGYALSCQDILSAALELGQRRMKPSFLELSGIMDKFSDTGTTLEHEVSIPIHLEDGSKVDVEFNPFTTIRDLITLVNSRTDLPESSQTGFGVFSDWPGVDSVVCCCPFLDAKMVDLIAVWFAALEELNNTRGGAGGGVVAGDSHKTSKYQRTIQLAYKKCQFLRKRIGFETTEEAILTAYQVSKSVHSGELPVPDRDSFITMAALLSQMEYGDWRTLHQQQEGESAEVSRDAVLLFCPRKTTHLALDHELASLQQQLEAKWKGLDGMIREACAKKYVEAVRDLDRYGITSFKAEEYTAGSSPQRPVQLAVSERGVAIYNRAGTSMISSYKYVDISSFGGNSDNTFMLVVLSQSAPDKRKRNSPSKGAAKSNPSSPVSSQRTVEKLTYAMHKLKICEATYLIATYIEMNKTQTAYDM